MPFSRLRKGAFCIFLNPRLNGKPGVVHLYWQLMARRKYLSPRAGEQLNWFKRIWSQIDVGHSNDYIFFHMRKADGTYISVLDHGRIVDSVRNGRVFYVMIMELNALQRHYGDCLELVEK